MAPVIHEFRVSPSAEAHMFDKHEVTLDEVLEAADSSLVHQRAGSESEFSLNPTGDRRYLIAGKTETGKRLWVIFANEGQGVGRIISAREAMGKQERERHRRMRGD